VSSSLGMPSDTEPDREDAHCKSLGQRFASSTLSGANRTIRCRRGVPRDLPVSHVTFRGEGDWGDREGQDFPCESSNFQWSILFGVATAMVAAYSHATTTSVCNVDCVTVVSASAPPNTIGLPGTVTGTIGNCNVECITEERGDAREWVRWSASSPRTCRPSLRPSWTRAATLGEAPRPAIGTSFRGFSSVNKRSENGYF